MTANQIKILVSGSVAGIGELLAKIANAPPELQTQIPQMFPEQFRGWISLVCQTLSGIAFLYALFVAHKPATAPSILLTSTPSVLQSTPATGSLSGPGFQSANPRP